MDMKITFVKEKVMVELACSSKERESTNEGGNTLTLHPSYDKLQKGNKEKSTKTQLALALGQSGKQIN
jgi:hypothetical protein